VEIAEQTVAVRKVGPGSAAIGALVNIARTEIDRIRSRRVRNEVSVIPELGGIKSACGIHRPRLPPVGAERKSDIKREAYGAAHVDQDPSRVCGCDGNTNITSLFRFVSWSGEHH